MSESVFIRTARLNDASTIKRLVRGAQLDPTSLDWQNFLVAEKDGRVIGVGQVKPYRASRELGSLVVLKAYRGQGVGAEIVRALIAREPGELFLLCQDRLESYYARFGFHQVQWRELRGTVRLKYTFAQVFRLLFRVRIIAMRSIPHPTPPSPSS